MKFNVKFFLMFFIVFSYPFSSAGTEAPEQLLMEYLFKNYNSLMRPSKIPNESVNVTVAMYMESLADVNDKEGTITVSGYIEMIWKDDWMCWDPSMFGNVSFFLAPAEKFWRPDLSFTTIIGERFFTKENQLIAVTNDCKLIFAPGGRGTHSCDLDVTLFPFDSQVCKFVISTWFSTAATIKLEAIKFAYDATKENEIWKIVKAESSYLTEGANAYGQVTFTLHIRRKALYYGLYVISPLFLLAVLNLMVFRLPMESDEKVTLAITVLLAFSFWLLMLNGLTPRSSDSIPILGIFIIVLMLMSSISTAATVYILRIDHTNKDLPIPLWARKLVRIWEARCKCSEMKRAARDDGKTPMGWFDVAEAMDSFGFVVMSVVTALMIVTSGLSILILKYNHAT